MDYVELSSRSLDMVFIQDTQKTVDNYTFLSDSVKEIESICRHVFCRHVFRLPRYLSGDVRFGLIAYHDGQGLDVPSSVKKLGFTVHRRQLIHELKSLQTHHTVMSSDGTNYALGLALRAASELEWRSDADKVVVLSISKHSRHLDSGAIKTLRYFSGQRIYLFITNGTKIHNLFDDGSDQVMVKRLNIATPMHISALMYAGLKVHSIRDEGITERMESVDEDQHHLVALILWAWGWDNIQYHTQLRLRNARQISRISMYLNDRSLSVKDDKAFVSATSSTKSALIQNANTGRRAPLGSRGSRLPNTENDLGSGTSARTTSRVSPGVSTSILADRSPKWTDSSRRSKHTPATPRTAGSEAAFDEKMVVALASEETDPSVSQINRSSSGLRGGKARGSAEPIMDAVVIPIGEDLLHGTRRISSDAEQSTPVVVQGLTTGGDQDEMALQASKRSYPTSVGARAYETHIRPGTSFFKASRPGDGHSSSHDDPVVSILSLSRAEDIATPSTEEISSALGGDKDQIPRVAPRQFSRVEPGNSFVSHQVEISAPSQSSMAEISGSLTDVKEMSGPTPMAKYQVSPSQEGRSRATADLKQMSFGADESSSNPKGTSTAARDIIAEDALVPSVEIGRLITPGSIGEQPRDPVEGRKAVPSSLEGSACPKRLSATSSFDISRHSGDDMLQYDLDAAPDNSATDATKSDYNLPDIRRDRAIAIPETMQHPPSQVSSTTSDKQDVPKPASVQEESQPTSRATLESEKSAQKSSRTSKLNFDSNSRTGGGGDGLKPAPYESTLATPLSAKDHSQAPSETEESNVAGLESSRGTRSPREYQETHSGSTRSLSVSLHESQDRLHAPIEAEGAEIARPESVIVPPKSVTLDIPTFPSSLSSVTATVTESRTPSEAETLFGSHGTTTAETDPLRDKSEAEEYEVTPESFQRSLKMDYAKTALDITPPSPVRHMGDLDDAPRQPSGTERARKDGLPRSTGELHKRVGTGFSSVSEETSTMPNTTLPLEAVPMVPTRSGFSRTEGKKDGRNLSMVEPKHGFHVTTGDKSGSDHGADEFQKSSNPEVNYGSGRSFKQVEPAVHPYPISSPKVAVAIAENQISASPKGGKEESAISPGGSIHNNEVPMGFRKTSTESTKPTTLIMSGQENDKGSAISEPPEAIMNQNSSKMNEVNDMLTDTSETISQVLDKCSELPEPRKSMNSSSALDTHATDIGRTSVITVDKAPVVSSRGKENWTKGHAPSEQLMTQSSPHEAKETDTSVSASGSPVAPGRTKELRVPLESKVNQPSNSLLGDAGGAQASPVSSKAVPKNSSPSSTSKVELPSDKGPLSARDSRELSATNSNPSNPDASTVKEGDHASTTFMKEQRQPSSPGTEDSASNTKGDENAEQESGVCTTPSRDEEQDQNRALGKSTGTGPERDTFSCGNDVKVASPFGPKTSSPVYSQGEEALTHPTQAGDAEQPKSEVHVGVATMSKPPVERQFESLSDKDEHAGATLSFTAQQPAKKDVIGTRDPAGQAITPTGAPSNPLLPTASPSAGRASTQQEEQPSILSTQKFEPTPHDSVMPDTIQQVASGGDRDKDDAGPAAQPRTAETPMTSQPLIVGQAQNSDLNSNTASQNRPVTNQHGSNDSRNVAETSLTKLDDKVHRSPSSPLSARNERSRDVSSVAHSDESPVCSESASESSAPEASAFEPSSFSEVGPGEEKDRLCDASDADGIRKLELEAKQDVPVPAVNVAAPESTPKSNASASTRNKEETPSDSLGADGAQPSRSTEVSGIASSTPNPTDPVLSATVDTASVGKEGCPGPGDEKDVLTDKEVASPQVIVDVDKFESRGVTNPDAVELPESAEKQSSSKLNEDAQAVSAIISPVHSSADKDEDRAPPLAKEDRRSMSLTKQNLSDSREIKNDRKPTLRGGPVEGAEELTEATQTMLADPAHPESTSSAAEKTALVEKKIPSDHTREKPLSGADAIDKDMTSSVSELNKEDRLHSPGTKECQTSRSEPSPTSLRLNDPISASETVPPHKTEDTLRDNEEQLLDHPASENEQDKSRGDISQDSSLSGDMTEPRSATTLGQAETDDVRSRPEVTESRETKASLSPSPSIPEGSQVAPTTGISGRKKDHPRPHVETKETELARSGVNQDLKGSADVKDAISDSSDPEFSSAIAKKCEPRTPTKNDASVLPESEYGSERTLPTTLEGSILPNSPSMSPSGTIQNIDSSSNGGAAEPMSSSRVPRGEVGHPATLGSQDSRQVSEGIRQSPTSTTGRSLSDVETFSQPIGTTDDQTNVIAEQKSGAQTNSGGDKDLHLSVGDAGGSTPTPNVEQSPSNPTSSKGVSVDASNSSSLVSSAEGEHQPRSRESETTEPLKPAGDTGSVTSSGRPPAELHGAQMKDAETPADITPARTDEVRAGVRSLGLVAPDPTTGEPPLMTGVEAIESRMVTTSSSPAAAQISPDAVSSDAGEPSVSRITASNISPVISTQVPQERPGQAILAPLTPPNSAARALVNATRTSDIIKGEMSKPVLVAAAPKVPYVQKIEFGEQPINREQTRRVVLEALVAISRGFGRGG